MISFHLTHNESSNTFRSRQRVEATVTAEISTMRLDMGDMQEALKAQKAPRKAQEHITHIYSAQHTSHTAHS